jgi:uncharacterized delta-60 repeat protein
VIDFVWPVKFILRSVSPMLSIQKCFFFILIVMTIISLEIKPLSICKIEAGYKLESSELMIDTKQESSKPGTLDPSFGSEGIILTQVGSNNDIASSVAIQPDGKIVVAGYTYSEAGSVYAASDFAVLRYNPDGSLDSGFGSGGKVITDFGAGEWANAVALQSDGKILVGGCYEYGTRLIKWLIARYNTDGILDTSFGDNGKVLTSISNYTMNLLFGLAVQDDGKIVGAGYGTASSKDEVEIARFDTDGSFDEQFGNNGQVATAIGSINARGYEVVISPDGKLIVFGDYDAGGRNNIFLLQYNVDGSLDAEFGTGGKVTASIGESDGGRYLALQPDGKIVVSGLTQISGIEEIFLARLNTDGSFDTGFGTGGKTHSSLAAGHSGANAVVIDDDGKIVVTGAASNSTEVNSPGSFGFTSPCDSDLAIARYKSDGSLDSSFGTGGYTLNHVGSGWANGMHLTLQSDGEVVVVGDAYNGNDFDFAIARYFTLSQPVVTTGDPTNILGVSATLNGILEDTGNNESVTVSFDWRTDTDYTGGNVSGAPDSLSSPGLFSASLTGLTIGETYHYRAKATGAATSYGSDQSFIASAGRLNIITPSQIIPAGLSSNPITVQTQDISGNPAVVASNTVINLTSSSTGGSFDIFQFGTFNISKITIPAGSNFAFFVYKDTNPGLPVITVTSDGLSSDSQEEIIGPAELFGNGQDGELVITSDTVDNPIDSACTGIEGSINLAATNPDFSSGQVVLIHQTQGAGSAGLYERNEIQEYNSGQITLLNPLKYTYITGAQVLVLKQYTDVTVDSGATWAAKTWNGTTGGILSFLACGTVTVNGKITAAGKGFRGGQGITGNVNGYQGESISGTGLQGIKASNANGGGAGLCNFGSGNDASGGGGGGNGAKGINGVSHGESVLGGDGGHSSGTADLSIMTLGGAGGSGGSGQGNPEGANYAGGNGGGILFFTAPTFINNNIITADGEAGGNGYVWGGAGSGGGAGGSIYMQSIVWKNYGTISSTGGAAGIHFGDVHEIHDGGEGSVGRIHLDYYKSFLGTTNPPLDASRIGTLDVVVTGIMAENKEYDGNTAAILNTDGVALAGVENGDEVILSTVSAEGQFSDKNVGTDKTVLITGLTIGGADAGYYSLPPVTTTASISPKDITVSGITAADKTYDGNTEASINTDAAILEGLIEGDIVNLHTETATGAFVNPEAGKNKTVLISGLTIDGTDAGNYTLVQPVATANINSNNTNNGGGGGGGGGSVIASKSIGVNILGKQYSLTVDKNGVVLNGLTASSPDGKLQITIKRGTRALVANKPISTLFVVSNSDPPAYKEKTRMISQVYDFGPDGTTFDQSLTLVYQINGTDLVDGIAAEDLYAALFDIISNQWVPLDTTIDIANNTLSAAVPHFSSIVILSPTKAEFALADLEVSRVDSPSGSKIFISAVVNNSGGKAGLYFAELLINGVVNQSTSIPVEAGGSQDLVFEVVEMTPGNYEVKLGELSGTFAIEAPPETAAAIPSENPVLTPAPSAQPIVSENPSASPSSFMEDKSIPVFNENQASATIPVDTAVSIPASNSGNKGLPAGILIGILAALILAGVLLWYYLWFVRQKALRVNAYESTANNYEKIGYDITEFKWKIEQRLKRLKWFLFPADLKKIDRQIEAFNSSISRMQYAERELVELKPESMFDRQVNYIKSQMKNPAMVESVEVELIALRNDVNRLRCTPAVQRNPMDGKTLDYYVAGYDYSFPADLEKVYYNAVLIGCGGFAKVFRCRRQSDEIEVAVKIPIHPDPATGKSFLREINSWQRLKHDNIVDLIDYNVFPIPFLEMELCDRSVFDLIKPMEITQASSLILNVAEGIKYAHAHNVVHRDLKPQNILLAGKVPKVSDWGMSKIMASNRSSIAQTVSPLYAAPEQLSPGKYGQADHRTDIYQLGVVFYELATGRLPFEGEDMVELIGEILNGEPEKISAINESAAEVEYIIMKCLKKNTNERYQSVSELQKELNRFIHHD